MKKKTFFLLLLWGISFSLMAQVTEGEDLLRTKAKDTVSGWKTGGVVAITGPKLLSLIGLQEEKIPSLSMDY